MCRWKLLELWIGSAGVLILGCHAPERIHPQFPLTPQPTLVSCESLSKANIASIDIGVASDACVLRFEEVVQRSKEYAINAGLLEMEQSLFQGTTPCTDAELEQVLNELFGRMINSKRNSAAQTAATCYFRLALASQQLKLIRKLTDDLDSLQFQVKKTQVAGGKSPVTVEELEDRKAVLAGQEVTARQAQVSLQLKLGELLGLAGEPSKLRCEDIRLLDGLPPKDATLEVSEAVERRSDLQATRFLLANLKRKTLPVVQAYLKQVDGALGQSPLPAQITGKARWHVVVDTVPGELQVRRGQLERLADSQSHAIEVQTSDSHSQLLSAQQQLTIALHRHEQASLRHKELLAHMGSAGVTEIGVRLAALTIEERQLDVLKSQTDVNLAYVQLNATKEAL